MVVNAIYRPWSNCSFPFVVLLRVHLIHVTARAVLDLPEHDLVICESVNALESQRTVQTNCAKLVLFVAVEPQLGIILIVSSIIERILVLHCAFLTPTASSRGGSLSSFMSVLFYMGWGNENQRCEL